MKKILFLFMLIPIIIYAQNPKRGFRFLKKEKYTKAKIIFNEARKKSKYYIVGYYGLALVYSAENNTKKNLYLAYNYITRAIKKYKYSGSKHRKYLNRKFNLTAEKIYSLHDTIIYRMQRQAMNGTIKQMTKFIHTIDDPKYTKKVERKRDSIIYRQVQEIDQFEYYKKFAEQYPNTVWRDSAKAKYEQIWKHTYNQIYRSLEYNDIYNFEKKYKDYPFYDDSTEIYKQWSIEAYNLKMMYGYSADKEPQYRKFIKKTAPLELSFVALQRLISPYIEKRQWNKALKIVLEFEPYFKNNAKYRNLIELLKSKEPKIKSKSFSPIINKPQTEEYAPVLSIDQKTLYFCSTGRDYQQGEDIYVSYFRDGQWTEPEKVKELSSIYNDAPMSITADGNKLLLFYNADIYYSEKTQFGWSRKKPIPEINSQYWEADAFITADGNAIFFASDRPENIGSFHEFSKPYHGDYIGNTDIYVIVKQKDETWSKPINLGPTINTPYAERTPYLHPDMKTLYFSSDGHGGFGRMDVFVAHRLSDTSWTQWSEPVNLGKGINTPKKEYGYKITTDGTKAYFSKIIDNEADIYYIDLPKKARPQPIALVTGVVKDKNTNEPIVATVVWEDLETGEKLGQLKTNPSNGAYTITLPIGKKYGIYISTENYYPISDNIDLTNYTESTNLTIDKSFQMIKLKDLIANEQTIELKNVFFDFSKAILKKESYPELNRLANFIKQNPRIKIQISGHTDNIGSKDYNKKLSEQRAQAVKDYLISQGCNPKQLITVGYGDTKPVATNTTENGRQKNRRVEFKIIK